MKLIPPAAVVSADADLAAHLDHRPEIYDFPNPWYLENWGSGQTDGKSLPARAARVTYVLVPLSLDRVSLPVFHKLLATGEFRVLYAQAGVVLLKRQAPAGLPWWPPSRFLRPS
jgi:hypothetical protein